MTSREFRQRLGRKVKKAGLNVPEAVIEGLEAYFRLLSLWNTKINLSGFRLEENQDQAIDRLLIEPLLAAQHVRNPSGLLIDVGSGGGSPAIPLRLAHPNLTLRMVESKTRKAVFLREAIRTLGLSSTSVETARFEELLTDPDLHEAADVVTIRAVPVEMKTLLNLQAFLKPRGEIFWFKGPGPIDAPEPLTPPLAWRVTVPLSDDLRSRLVILQKTR